MSPVEISSPGAPTRIVHVDRPVVVGRDEDADHVVPDPSVSRRHLRLEPAAGNGVVVVDLGSANGTAVDGVAVTAPRVAGPGSRIRLGDTVVTVLGAGPSPALAGLSSQGPAGVVIDATLHPRLGPTMQSSANRAWRRLSGLLPKGAELRPVIHLVHPFASPDDPDQAVTEGSVIDAAGTEAWTVVGRDASPDEPGRILGRMLVAHLPGGEDLSLLLEGYGLHVAGVDDTDDLVRSHATSSPSTAVGEARAAAAVSFVRFLLGREGEETLRDLLRTTTQGRLDEAVHRAYGRSLHGLEQAWALQVHSGSDQVRTGAIVRMSLRYLRRYRWRQGEIFGLMLLSLAFTVAFPFASRHLLDEAIPSGRFSEVAGLLGVLGIAFAISMAAGLRQAYQVAYVSGSVIRDLRQQVFDRLQYLPLGWFEGRQQGDVLSRLFSDVRVVESGLSQTISQGVFQVLTLVVTGGVMLTISPLLGGVVLLGAPAVAVVHRQMRGGARRRSIARQEESSAQMSVAAENFAAQPVVKAFGLQRRESVRFAAASARVFRAERRLSLFGGLFELSIDIIVTALRLGVLALGAWLIFEGRLTIGGLVAFLAVMGDVLGPVTVLTSIGQELQRCSGALIRLEDVLEAPTEVDDGDTGGRSVLGPVRREIRLDSVSFGYGSGRPVLFDVDCVIPFGSKVAFVGPSGCGKSTLLRLLLRLDDPDSGRVLVDGTDLRGVDRASWRSQLGMVSQDPFLFDASVRDNIAAGRAGATDDEVVAAARAAEADSFITSLERGYHTTVGERGAQLSGGQRQRVALARALVRQPRILVLDEATSALDPRTERAVEATLSRLDNQGSGRTTVSVTHKLSSVTGYDRIFVMSDGRIVASGNHQELLAEGGLYAQLWSEQHGARIPDDEAVAVPPGGAPRGEVLGGTGAVRRTGIHVRPVEVTQ